MKEGKIHIIIEYICTSGSVLYHISCVDLGLVFLRQIVFLATVLRVRFLNHRLSYRDNYSALKILIPEKSDYYLHLDAK